MKKFSLALLLALFITNICYAEQAKAIDISLGEIIGIALAAIAAYVLIIYIIALIIFTLLNRILHKPRKGMANTFTGALLFSFASVIFEWWVGSLIVTLLGAVLGYFMTPTQKDKTPVE